MTIQQTGKQLWGLPRQGWPNKSSEKEKQSISGSVSGAADAAIRKGNERHYPKHLTLCVLGLTELGMIL